MGDRADRRSFVLVHGGYHAAWCWSGLLPHLSGPALAVDLPGRGSHPMSPDEVTIEDSAESVVADIDAAGFDEVVLVGHSLGGVTLPAVARRLGNRLVHLVFVSCLVAPEGESVQSMTPADQREAADRRLRTGPGERTELAAEHHRDLLGNDMSEEQLADTLARVGPDSMRFFTDVVRWGEGRRPPTTYVRLRHDRAVPWENQEEMIRRLGPGVAVREIAAGHEVMITQPEALADILNPLLSEGSPS
jgi:pimeloyl-ACP methyl ester carboxylesterase